jgi:flagellar FliJ protein
MGFRFRYEALLNYRGHLKEMAEIEVSGARRRLRDARDELDHMKAERIRARATFERRVSASISSDELQRYSEFMTGLEEGILVKEHKVAECLRVVEKKTEHLLVKTREYRVIEKLREKDLRKWRHLQDQLEQKWMDEVGVTRHGRDYR